MKILNLFSGIGGNRTLWGNKHEITAVESNQQIAMIYLKRFPNDIVIVGDAYEYLENHYKEFDFIWASPPCPTHSILMFPQKNKKLPDLRLFSIIIFLQHHYHNDWVVENVCLYYKPLVPITVKLERHMFWSNRNIKEKEFNISRKRFDYLSINDFCNIHNIERNLFDGSQHNNTEVRKLLRNCVNYKVGKYILDSITNQKQTTLEGFIS